MVSSLLIIALFLFVLSLVFMLFAYISKQQDDEGAASTYLSIGVVILILDVIYFMLIVNVFQLYE